MRARESGAEDQDRLWEVPAAVALLSSTGAREHAARRLAGEALPPRV